jgi:hypothetical protein
MLSAVKCDLISTSFFLQTTILLRKFHRFVSNKLSTGYCNRLVNADTVSLVQSDHIKRLLLNFKNEQKLAI